MKENSPFAGKATIIMDFDGTVADTNDIHSSAFAQVLRDYPISFDYKKYAGWRTEDVLRDVLDKVANRIPEQDIRNLAQAKREYARREFGKGLSFVAGAEAFIDKARCSGYRLCLATGASSGSVSQAMRILGLEGKFEPVITADDIAVSKPNPQVYLESLKRLGEAATRAIVIEDAMSGVLSAIGAGIDVICLDVIGDREYVETSTKVYHMTYPEMEKNL